MTSTKRPSGSRHARGSIGWIGVWSWLMIGGLSLVACDANSPTAGTITPAADDSDLCDDPNAPDAAAGAELALEQTTITSNDGSYRLTIEPERGVIPRNRYFALNITVEGASSRVDPEALTLAVSGAMPHHEHGLNTHPIVERGSGNATAGETNAVRYRAHGLLLHMPGRWELYFDLTDAGITERAQFTIELP